MMRGQLQEGAGALATDDGKQLAHLVLGEEGDRGQWRGVFTWLHEADRIAVLSDGCQGAWDQYTRTLLLDMGSGLSSCRIGAVPSATRRRPPRVPGGIGSPDTRWNLLNGGEYLRIHALGAPRRRRDRNSGEQCWPLAQATLAQRPELPGQECVCTS